MVLNFLDATFPDRWIGNGGPTEWSQHSPDIKPLDFILWRIVKDYVFQIPVRYFETLWPRISGGNGRVTPDMLANTWHELEYRLDVLRANTRAYVEVD